MPEQEKANDQRKRPELRHPWPCWILPPVGLHTRGQEQRGGVGERLREASGDTSWMLWIYADPRETRQDPLRQRRLKALVEERRNRSAHLDDENRVRAERACHEAPAPRTYWTHQLGDGQNQKRHSWQHVPRPHAVAAIPGEIGPVEEEEP